MSKISAFLSQNQISKSNISKISLIFKWVKYQQWLVLRFLWNFELTILPKVLAKPSAIFRLLPELFPCPWKKLVEKLHNYALRYFHSCQNFEITIFAEIVNIVEIFRKDSIFRAKVFAKVSRIIDESFGAATLAVTFEVTRLAISIHTPRYLFGIFIIS